MADKNKPTEFYEPNPTAPLSRRQKTAAVAAEAPAAAPSVPGPAPQASALAALEVEAGAPDLTADAGIAVHQSEPENLHADIARIRKLRRPFGAFTQKLALERRAGYHSHWFNDEPGRVDEAKTNGWAHRTDKEGKPVKRVVGRGRDSGPMFAYAMDLPLIFWEEDMKARHDAAQARIDEIKKNPIQAKPGQAQASDRDKFYSPKDSAVTVTSSTVRS